MQFKFIRAQVYDDRLSEHLSRFNARPHCGTYFFSKFWTRRTHKWYCEMNYAKWCELADPEDVKKLQEAWGHDLGSGRSRTAKISMCHWLWAGLRRRVQEYKDGGVEVVPGGPDPAGAG